MGFGGRGSAQRKPLRPSTQHPAPIEGLITAIEPQVRGGGRRANIFVDGRYALSLSIELAAGLRVGSAVDAQAVLHGSSTRTSVPGPTMPALRFLGVRPRSEREIRDRLGGTSSSRRRSWTVPSNDCAASALWTTRHSPSIWVEQRVSHRPRGGRLLKQELRAKGVDVETAAAALPPGEDEAEGAYRAAARKAQSMRSLDERTFRQRLGGFLQRRGFDYQTTKSVVTRLAAELGVSSRASDEDASS